MWKKPLRSRPRPGQSGFRPGYTDEEFTATISMPEPKFEKKEIPATGDGEYHERIGEFEVYAVNTGVPHAVVLADSVDSVDIGAAAPLIRHHTTFPEGANVNFVEKTGDDSLRIRTFERGVEEETLSCGTGATASAAVVRRLGHMKDTIHVETRGGPLTISFRDGVKMEGPAVTVYSAGSAINSLFSPPVLTGILRELPAGLHRKMRDRAAPVSGRKPKRQDPGVSGSVRRSRACRMACAVTVPIPGTWMRSSNDAELGSTGSRPRARSALGSSLGSVLFSSIRGCSSVLEKP